MKKERVHYIDIAKAFAILFIALGHTIVHSENCTMIFKFLYSFHVVLFFMLSGYTFKIKKNEKITVFLKEKFTRLMIPYFVWAILYLVPYMILGKNIGSTLQTNSSFDLRTQLFNILYGIGASSALKQNSSLWFLPALFSMEIIYYYVIKFIQKYKKSTPIVVIFSIVIGYISALMNFKLPWGINTTLNLGMLFLVGYLAKQYNVFTKEGLFKPYFIIPITIIGLFACFLNYKSVSCIDYSYGNFTLCLISGLSLSISTIYISYIISRNKVLEYIGRNTLGALIFHKLVILVFQTKLGIISKLLRNSNIFIELTLGIIIAILSIIFSLAINEFIKKYIPILLGEKRISN